MPQENDQWVLTPGQMAERVGLVSNLLHLHRFLIH